MRAGQYRLYANIEHFVTTGTSVQTGVKGTWQALYSNVPVSIDTLSGRQLELARQQVATATHKIGMRYQPGITPMMRVNYNGRLFHIDFINEGDLRDRYLTFTTTEQQTGG